jgi:hypothetical protein
MDAQGKIRSYRESWVALILDGDGIVSASPEISGFDRAAMVGSLDSISIVGCDPLPLGPGELESKAHQTCFTAPWRSHFGECRIDQRDIRWACSHGPRDIRK